MRSKVVTTLATSAFALALVSSATAQPASADKPMRDIGDTVAKPVGLASATTLGSVNSAAFVENAARSDMFEIRASKLAEMKSSSPEIKSFAAAMIKGHMKTTAGLKKAIAEGDVKTPIPAGLDKRRKGMLDNLRASTGPEFDKRYVAQQIAAHEEALNLMKGYADHGDNPALKDAAAKTAPIVQMHLDMAKQLPSA